MTMVIDKVRPGDANASATCNGSHEGEATSLVSKRTPKAAAGGIGPTSTFRCVSCAEDMVSTHNTTNRASSVARTFKLAYQLPCMWAECSRLPWHALAFVLDLICVPLYRQNDQITSTLKNQTVARNQPPADLPGPVGVRTVF